MKIINAARGGIVNEEDLVVAINNGHVSGAALDVFVEEPPKYYDLVKNSKIIATPHIGASTIEAQNRVAVEIAQNIISLNEGKENFSALNANEVLSKKKQC